MVKPRENQDISSNIAYGGARLKHLGLDKTL